MGGSDDPAAAPVWVRANVAVSTCPKSYISSESQSLVEEFWIRRRLGGIRAAELTARQADAFVLLEHELLGGRQNGQCGAREAV